MTARKILILALIGFVFMGIFSYTFLDARIMRDGSGFQAMRYEYDTSKKVLSPGEVINEDTYPFPILVVNRPLAVALSIDAMVNEGQIEKGLHVVYLSPNLRYPSWSSLEPLLAVVPGMHNLHDSNLVKYLCDKSLASQVTIVMPKYMQDENHDFYRRGIERLAARIKDPVTVINSFKELSINGQDHNILLVVDTSYFDSEGPSFHFTWVKSGDIEWTISQLRRTLRDKNINISGLIVTLPTNKEPRHVDDAIINSVLGYFNELE